MDQTLGNTKPESEKKYLTVECGRCGTCCTEPVVPVTDSDVRRLCDARNLSAERIVRFYSQKEMEYDSEADLWISLSRGKRAMGLRKRKARCMFLTDENDCSVYPYRPMTCRTFPYMVEFDEAYTVEKVSLNKIVNCRCKRKPKSSIPEVIQNVRTEYTEDDSYYDKILQWNLQEQPGSPEEFLRFIGLK